MTLARWLPRALVWICFGLGLAAGIFVGRLSTGPVALDWMKPRVEEALAPGNKDLQVTVGETALRFDERRRTVELVALDVQYSTADGQPVLTFPEVEVALSVEAFLKHGLIAASKIVARAPSLRLTRDADGVIGLHTVEMGEGQSLSNADFVAFLHRFLLAPKADDRIAFLKRLQISGGRISFSDQARADALTAKSADLVLIRQDDGVSGWLKADLLLGEGRTSLQILGRVDEQAERVHLDVDLADLIVADLVAPWRSELPRLPPLLDRVRSPVHASIKGDVDFEGALSPLQVEIQMTDGILDLPRYFAKPLDVTFCDVKGVIAPSFDNVDIERFQLVSDDAELTAKGQASFREEAPSLLLDLTASNVRAEDLRSFWPLDFGADGRDWVVRNITSGLVPHAEARLELRADDFGPEPLRDDALSGSFAFEEVSVRYVDTMPPVEKGKGIASFDADHLYFDVETGENAGVDLVGGTVTITGLGKPGKLATKLQVLANAKGPVDRALALLDHPPLDVAKDLEIAPEQTSGVFEAALDIRLPLYDDVTEDDVDVLADAELSQIAVNGLPRLGDDVQLDEGRFRLVVGAETVTLDGNANVADVPLGIDIEEPLVEGTAKRRILLKGRLNRATLERFDIPTDGMDGSFAFDATLTETSDNIWVDLEADLTDLAWALPGFSWTKAVEDEGKLLASIAVPNDGPIDVKQFELTAKDLHAVGSLRLSAPDYQVDALALSDVRLGNNSGSFRLQPHDDFGHEIVIEAKRLDLDSLLTDDDDSEIDLDVDRLKMAMRADELVYKGLELGKIQADATRLGGEWRTASFLGALTSGGKIALELEPKDNARHLDIRSDDAGALIRALDLGQRIEGGDFHLALTMTSQEPLQADGRLEIDSFIAADAPLLARLLTIASFTGIGNLLEGQGIQVDELILPFSLADRKITLTDGLLRGSQLGLTTKGTVDLDNEAIDIAGTIIPIYSLNRLIGQVPLIGRILTGIDGRGAFAATYRIAGPQSQPEVFVNPLSILTPGLIRDFFVGLANGTLEPPDIPASDD